jgi:Tfp pilus assembly protein PilF
MSKDSPKPPAEWLQHLHEAGQWERLMEMAKKSLAADPRDEAAHRHLAWAYAKTGQSRLMAPHVEFLLGEDADHPDYHHLAAIHHLGVRQPKQAKTHIDHMLQGCPYHPNYHYVACIHALRCNDPESARHHIQQARRLAPEWAAAAHLEIGIASIHETKAHQSWDRIRRLEETLALDPEDEDVMASMGDIYLLELERPRDAERLYRSALAIDPMDEELRRKLLNAVRARSLLYRTLSMPVSALGLFRIWWHKRAFGCVFLVLAFKGFMAFMLWLIVMGAMFTPAAKVYEWLVLSSVVRPRWQAHLWRPLAWLFQAPLWLRLMIALGIIFGVWLAVVSRWLRTSLWESAEIIAWIFGLHFGGLVLWIGFRKLRSALGKWWNARGQKRDLMKSALLEGRAGSE